MLIKFRHLAFHALVSLIQIGTLYVSPAHAQVSAAATCARSSFEGGGASLTPCLSVGGNSAGGSYVPGKILETGLLSNTDPNDQYFLASRARADYGVLGVSTRSELRHAIPVDAVQVATYAVSAGANTNWRDVITVNSDALPIGELVKVRATQIIDIHDVSSESSLQALSGALVGAILRGYNSFSGISTFQQSCIGAGYVNCLNTPLIVGRNELSIDFDLHTGYDFYIEGVLDSSTYVSSNPAPAYGPQFARTSADAMNTAYTYLTVLTPGATLASASGHNYALPSISAVPEPASWLMMISGFGLVGMAIRRKSSQSGWDNWSDFIRDGEN